MRRTSTLPPDWKQRLEKSIRKGESPIAYNPSSVFSGYFSGISKDSGIQRDMLRLLRHGAVSAAAEYLWKNTAKRPVIQTTVPATIHRALWWLAVSLQVRAKERSATEYRKIVKTLEQVDRDYELLVSLGQANQMSPLDPSRLDEMFMSYMATAINFYRLKEKEALQNKLNYKPQRMALGGLRREFRDSFGRRHPMDQAVAYIMEAAFGVKMDVKTLRVRASEWKC